MDRPKADSGAAGPDGTVVLGHMDAARPIIGQCSPVVPRGDNAQHHPGLVVSQSSAAQHQPIVGLRVTGGWLATWQELNLTATIPHCIEQLEASGVLDNFRRVIGESPAEYRGFVFADSDLYKVIEAVAWEIGRSGTHCFDDWLDQVIGLIGRVQATDGYVDTWIQGVHPEKRFAELEWTHEMYVMGHLIQAGVALARCAGRDDLLDIARRAADLLVDQFANGPGICGHPEIEMALVELYRVTGQVAYLHLAQTLIDRRGHGWLPVGAFGAEYFQDHTPIRQAETVVGHAVRQLYLNSGVTDVYLETGDTSLLSAMETQWEAAHQRKMYITGAFGPHHQDEAFGADYELPPDRAYAETCATIADLQWCWRMLLAGGAAGPGAYASVMEREIHNALRASIDSSGTSFFYSNPLQRRTDDLGHLNAPTRRQPWYDCACCPPNIARTVAQLHHYLCTVTDRTLWWHLLAAAEVTAPAGLGEGRVMVMTDYPLTGRVEIRVAGSFESGAVLALRLPSWSADAVVRRLRSDGSMELGHMEESGGTVLGGSVATNPTKDAQSLLPTQESERRVINPGESGLAGGSDATQSDVARPEVDPDPSGEQWAAGLDGYVCLPLADGETYVTELDLSFRLTRPHHRLDAVRGCVAIERGPEVWCLEQADLPEGWAVEDVVLATEVAPAGPVVRCRRAASAGELYVPLAPTPMDGSVVMDSDAAEMTPTDRPAGAVATIQTGQCDSESIGSANAVEGAGSDSGSRSPEVIEAPIIRFADWGNRTPGAMKVWLPLQP